MAQLLSLLVPVLLLAYYLRIVGAGTHDKKWLVGFLVGGTCLYYIGMLLTRIYTPGLGTTLQLTGACLFFTGVAAHTLRRPSDPTVGLIAEGKDESIPAGEGDSEDR